MTVSEVEVPAVYEEDLERVLGKLEILQDILEGKVSCFICDTVLTLDNVGGITKINGNLKVICDDAACLETAIAMSRALR